MNPVAATGEELRRFLADMVSAHGSVHLYRDPGQPLDVEVNGTRAASQEALEQIPSDAAVKVSGFVALGQQTASRSLQRVFRDWRKGQSSVSQTVMVPQEKLLELQQFVKSIGGTLLP